MLYIFVGEQLSVVFVGTVQELNNSYQSVFAGNVQPVNSDLNQGAVEELQFFIDVEEVDNADPGLQVLHSDTQWREV